LDRGSRLLLCLLASIELCTDALKLLGKKSPFVGRDVARWSDIFKFGAKKSFLVGLVVPLARASPRIRSDWLTRFGDCSLLSDRTEDSTDASSESLISRSPLDRIIEAL